VAEADVRVAQDAVQALRAGPLAVLRLGRPGLTAQASTQPAQASAEAAQALLPAPA